MDAKTTTVVIGAGPYGLSAAAHLQARGIPTLILGKPMEFWQRYAPQDVFEIVMECPEYLRADR